MYKSAPIFNQKVYLNSNHSQYLQNQMERVSRSFALVVASVEQPLQAYLATAYLLCRVIDNIEDCHQVPLWKKQRFSEYELMLADPALADEILKIWEVDEWPGLTQDEKRLMGSTYGLPLWQIYASLPSACRSIMHRWNRIMAQGMSQLDDQADSPLFIRHEDVLVLSREADYNQYCYIVAGTVGNMATELVIDYYQLESQIANQLLSSSETCGRALQKTNILKDYVRDLERGICYLPAEWLKEIEYTPLYLHGAPLDWKQMTLQNVLNELHTATEYVLTLPYQLKGYRMASLLCLLPAYQTNLLAAEKMTSLFTSQHSYKISRQSLSLCVRDARRMLLDNELVIDYAQKTQTTIERLYNHSRELSENSG